MPKVAHSEPVRCTQCGRLYRAEAGRKLCHHCSGEGIPHTHAPLDDDPLVPASNKRYAALMALYDAQSEGVHAGLIPESDDSVKTPAISTGQVFDPHRECALCEKPPLKGSEFCLGCQTKLHRDFGDAAHELFTEMETVEENNQGSIRSVMFALNSARARSPHLRINPVAMGKLKT